MRFINSNGFSLAWEGENPAAVIKMANGITKGLFEYDPFFIPSPKWAHRAMLQEHSTLEWAHLIIISRERSDVCSHLVRHTKGHPRHVVESHRPDWTGKERPGSGVERLYAGSWTPLAIIQMARQRLCSKSMAETRATVERLKKALSHGDELMQALSWAMKPECKYRKGCIYDRGCGRDKP